MAKALLQRVMHWVNKATKHISIYTTHFRETGLEMKQNVRAVKGKKLSNSSTFLLTSYFSTSAGTTSFHGNAQVISIDYIFFLSVCEGRVSPWRLRGQQSVVANLRNKDELHKVGFHKFSTFKKSLVLWNNLSKSQKVKRKKNSFGDLRYSSICVIEGDRQDASVAIFTLPSVCMGEMLQLQFQAFYLLIGVQPTHYWAVTSTHCVPHLHVHVADIANRWSCYSKYF